MNNIASNRIKINYDKFIKAQNGSNDYVDMDPEMVKLFDYPSTETKFSVEYWTSLDLINSETGKRRQNVFEVHYDGNKIWLELLSWSKSISEQEIREAFDEFKEFFIKLSFAGYTDIKIRKQKKEDKSND